jgi:hypothetical protein
MEESPRLTEASIQDIQLELIRRASFNAFDGERERLISFWWG